MYVIRVKHHKHRKYVLETLIKGGNLYKKIDIVWEQKGQDFKTGM